MDEKPFYNEIPLEGGKLPDWEKEGKTVDRELTKLYKDHLATQEGVPATDEILESGDVSEFLEDKIKEHTLYLEMKLEDAIQTLRERQRKITRREEPGNHAEIMTSQSTVEFLEKFIRWGILHSGMQLDEVLGALLDWREKQRKEGNE